jgi:hypothetical protein
MEHWLAKSIAAAMRIEKGRGKLDDHTDSAFHGFQLQGA